MSVAEYFSSMEYGPAPEDDQPARAWLAQHDASFGHFIGGGWRAPASGERFESREPATGEL
jgi:aldehyde dehydrogenase (NAD+)